MPEKISLNINVIKFNCLKKTSNTVYPVERYLEYQNDKSLVQVTPEAQTQRATDKQLASTVKRLVVEQVRFLTIE